VFNFAAIRVHIVFDNVIFVSALLIPMHIYIYTQDIQTFSCYSHMLWSALLEIVLSSTLLYIVLGQAAFGGFAIMLVSLGLGLLVSKL